MTISVVLVETNKDLFMDAEVQYMRMWSQGSIFCTETAHYLDTWVINVREPTRSQNVEDFVDRYINIGLSSIYDYQIVLW